MTTIVQRLTVQTLMRPVRPRAVAFYFRAIAGQITAVEGDQVHPPIKFSLSHRITEHIESLDEPLSTARAGYPAGPPQ